LFELIERDHPDRKIGINGLLRTGQSNLGYADIGGKKGPPPGAWGTRFTKISSWMGSGGTL